MTEAKPMGALTLLLMFSDAGTEESQREEKQCTMGRS